MTNRAISSGKPMVTRALCATSHAVVAVLTSSLIFAVCGCGGGEKDARPSAGKAAGAPAESRSHAPRAVSDQSPANDAAAHAAQRDRDAADSPRSAHAAVKGAATGELVGRIVYDGPAPELPPLVRKGDESVKDAAVCAADDIPDQSLLVNASADNGLANVFVYMSRPPSDAEIPPPPEEPVVFDQHGCVYLPHAQIARVGQPVVIKSNDNIAHNVHTYPLTNQGDNQLLEPKDRTGLKVVYQRKEFVPMKIGCDIHKWMSAYLLPVEHSFATVTDDEGRFAIRGLPPGKHTVSIWHEKAGFLDRKYEFEIKSGEAAEVTLRYPAERFR